MKRNKLWRKMVTKFSSKRREETKKGREKKKASYTCTRFRNMTEF